jgi:uncharacterized protein YcbK (DUF882 family)
MSRYFSSNEVRGLTQEMVDKLDMARYRAGIEFRVTSGYRTPEQNRMAGGVENSEHTTGEGVDISAPDSYSRFRIVEAALYVGFTRIGVYDRHVHLGVSKKHPQLVLWVGASQ